MRGVTRGNETEPLRRRGDAVWRGCLSPSRGGRLPPTSPRGGERRFPPEAFAGRSVLPDGGRGAERNGLAACWFGEGDGAPRCSRRPSSWPPAPPGATHRHRPPRPSARKSGRGQVARPCPKSPGRGWEVLLCTSVVLGAACEIPSPGRKYPRLKPSETGIPVPFFSLSRLSLRTWLLKS